MLELDGVNKSFGELHVLHGIDLSSSAARSSA